MQIDEACPYCCGHNPPASFCSMCGNTGLSRNAPTIGAERYWEARWRDEKAENERLLAAVAEARINTIEECARLVELIASDWRAAGADQKVSAAEYLAREIRYRAQTAAVQPEVCREEKLI